MTFPLDSDVLAPPPVDPDATLTVSVKSLHEVLKENTHLRKQVHELHSRMSEMVNTSLPRSVRTFMLKIGHTIRHRPTVPPEAEVRLRMRLIGEEFLELARAVFGTSFEEGSSNEVAHYSVADDLRRMIEDSPVTVDLPEMADALADLDYVVEGTRAAFGIDGPTVHAEVQRANMAKVNGGTLREDGKFLKPAGWTPPDIAGVLKRLGWNGFDGRTYKGST